MFWVSKQYIMKVNNEIEEKFNTKYKEVWELYNNEWIVYKRYDTKKYHWHTKTFDWLMKISEEELTNRDLHWVKENYINFLKEEEKFLKNLKKK